MIRAGKHTIRSAQQLLAEAISKSPPDPELAEIARLLRERAVLAPLRGKEVPNA